MYIQIDKTNFVNKGAELMLQAIIQRLEHEHKLDPKFVFGRGPVVEGTRKKLRQNGFYEKFQFQRFKLQFENFMEQKRLDQFHLVKEDNIQVVLDAGGFQFGDQWEKSFTEKDNNDLKNYYEEHKKRGCKLIFLPQAFGPFEEELSLKRIKFVFELADLIYARDPISYENLVNIFGKNDKLKIAPDFTILVKPDLPYSIYKKVSGAVCIVPNAKMLTKTSSSVAEKYIQFLTDLAKHFISKGEKVVLLNHEWKGDLEIIEKIDKSLGNKLIVLNDLDAVSVKGVIGHSKLLISSRFHGVVSGLNQKVPTFCTSWSHKYYELLKLYGVKNAVLDVNNDIASTIKQIEENQDQNISDLKIRELEKQTEAMWEDIIGYIQN